MKGSVARLARSPNTDDNDQACIERELRDRLHAAAATIDAPSTLLSKMQLGFLRVHRDERTIDPDDGAVSSCETARTGEMRTPR
jgi:hypothetical protein